MTKNVANRNTIRIAKTDKTRQNFEAVIGGSPPGSVELRLFYGRNEEISIAELEERLSYLFNPKNRSVTSRYRRAAIALLEQELNKRGSCYWTAFQEKILD